MEQYRFCVLPAKINRAIPGGMEFEKPVFAWRKSKGPFISFTQAIEILQEKGFTDHIPAAVYAVEVISGESELEPGKEVTE